MISSPARRKILAHDGPCPASRDSDVQYGLSSQEAQLALDVARRGVGGVGGAPRRARGLMSPNVQESAGQSESAEPEDMRH